MRLGALLGPVPPGSDARLLAEQARRYEAAGFRSLWTGHAMGRGFMLTDPLQAMTIAAVQTRGLEIGSAIIQLPLYHPVDLAHRLLSLQQICEGPLLFGVGTGSTAADFRAIGGDYDRRFKVYQENLPVVRSLLATGRWGDVDLKPWPEVLDRIRLCYGTWGAGVEDAARSYDAWIASGNYRTQEELAKAMACYRAAGGKRAIVSTIIVTADTDTGALRDRLLGYAEIGFDDAVVMLQPGAVAAETVARLVDA